MDDELRGLRRQIDELDRKLLALLSERIRLVLRVGDYKRERDIKVYDALRERAVLERLSELAEPPLTPEAARRVFERIIDESRNLEQQHVRKD